jgi:hypothetical protein
LDCVVLLPKLSYPLSNDCDRQHLKHKPMSDGANHDVPNVDALQSEAPGTVADTVTPLRKVNSSIALSTASATFWETWSMAQGILDWYDGDTRRRVSFADDAEPEPTKLGGCQCADHKVYFGENLVVSAYVTIVRDPGRCHKRNEHSATMKLHTIYRHFYGRHTGDNDDDDSDAHSLVNPFEGEQLFRSKSEFTMEHAVAVSINDRADAVSKARAVFSMLISKWQEAHATVMICAICHRIEAAGTRTQGASVPMCDECRLCNASSRLLDDQACAQVCCCICLDESDTTTAFNSTTLCGCEQHRIHVYCRERMVVAACPLCRQMNI